MTSFTSPTPELDLTLQNLANSATIIQAVAYYQQSDGSGSLDSSKNPHMKHWRRIGKVAVILLNNKLIIPPGELEDLRSQLEDLESDWVELEDILTQKKTLWGRFRRVLGKPMSTGVEQRLSQFEQRAFNLDLQAERASARALVQLTKGGALSPSSGMSGTRDSESTGLSPANVNTQPPLAPWQPQTPAAAGNSSGASTSIATQIAPRGEFCASSGWEPRMGFPTTSRNPFLDPSSEIIACLEDDEGGAILLLPIS